MDNRSAKPVVDQVFRNAQALKQLGATAFRGHGQASREQQGNPATLPLLEFDLASILPGFAFP